MPNDNQDKANSVIDSADDRPRKLPYADDALMMDRNTTTDDILEFLEDRANNPIIMSGVTIWNFSSHEVDLPALAEAVQNKLEQDRYIIPFQVTGAWGYMTYLLPEQIVEAEVLVYHPDSGDYAGYKNYLTELKSAERERFVDGLRDSKKR